jgi:Uri superfamily endonuclease
VTQVETFHFGGQPTLKFLRDKIQFVIAFGKSDEKCMNHYFSQLPLPLQITTEKRHFSFSERVTLRSSIERFSNSA